MQYSGKPAPNSWIGKQLAGQLFGGPDDRTGRTLEEIDGKDVGLHDQNSQQIGAMWNDGTAAAVKIIGEGKRQLRGNFFSADGYNLKNNDNKVDTSRPVVLLLTGSGGSAEEQGFDVAKFYTANGASVLSVNYAGFGGNAAPPDDTSELSLQQDAQSMLQHLINLGYDPDKIIIHGYSMGAAVAAELQRANEAPRDGAPSSAVRSRTVRCSAPCMGWKATTPLLSIPSRQRPGTRSAASRANAPSCRWTLPCPW